MEKNVYEAPESELKVSETAGAEWKLTAEEQKLKGLGGWLILVGLGVVFGPIRMLVQTVPLYYSMFAEGTFGLLTNPDSDYYTPFMGAYIVAEMICNLAILLASVYLIYLFFSKHYLFPKLYIAVLVASIVFIFTDAWVGTFFFPDEPLMDEEIAREFGRSIIGAIIWIPYMLISKRVKLTFVEHRPG